MGGGTVTGAALLLQKWQRKMDVLNCGNRYPCHFYLKVKCVANRPQLGIGKITCKCGFLLELLSIIINLREVIYGNFWDLRLFFPKADEVLATAASWVAEVITTSL